VPMEDGRSMGDQSTRDDTSASRHGRTIVAGEGIDVDDRHGSNEHRSASMRRSNRLRAEGLNKGSAVCRWKRSERGFINLVNKEEDRFGCIEDRID